MLVCEVIQEVYEKKDVTHRGGCRCGNGPGAHGPACGPELVSF
jgi:hypothetical protein